jgi:hypothetical protein
MFVSANIQAGQDRTRDGRAIQDTRDSRAIQDTRDSRAIQNTRDSRAIQNREYVRELLAERQPELAALLRAVERQMDQERPHDTCDWRRTMNTAWLYHPDGSECVDSWSCQAQDHTSIPPRCRTGTGTGTGTGADGGLSGCELPKGHPGPHLRFADGECCGSEDDHPAALAC